MAIKINHKFNDNECECKWYKDDGTEFFSFRDVTASTVINDSINDWYSVPSKMVIRPLEGFKIDSVTLEDSNQENEWVYRPEVIDGVDCYTFNATSANANYYSDPTTITQRVVTSPVSEPTPPPDYVVKQNDIDRLDSNNSTMTINGDAAVLGSEILDGDLLEIVVTGGDVFSTNGVYLQWQNPVSGYMMKEYFTLETTEKATLTFDGSHSYSGLYVNTETPPPTPDYVVKQSDIDELNLSGSTLKINGSVAAVDSEIFEGDLLEVEAGAGFEFYPDSPAYNVSSSVYFSGQNGPAGVLFYLGFELGADNSTASVTFVNDSSGYNYFGLTVGTVQVDEVTGTNNVYLINSNKLAELNNERFIGTPPNVYDYGQFILNVLELPFSIPEDIILDPELIMFATYETTIQGDKIKTDKIKIDLGEISIPETSLNLLDFKNVTASIHLPRIEPLIIDVDYVIGETVSIEYIIDCYTGIATVNIYSTKIGGVVLTKQVDIGVNIPYAVETGNATLYNSNVDVGGDNGVIKPFIEILKNEAVLADGFFTIPIDDEDFLSNQAGFIRVEEIELATKASYSEKSNLVLMLQGGVVIK